MAETETTLEEAARMLADAQLALTQAAAAVEETQAPYYAAISRQDRARQEVKRIEQGMGAVVRGSMIRSALDAAGIEYDGPVLIAQPVYKGADLHYLSAVGPAGTGLYIFKPERSHRYHGTQHAILIVHANAAGVEERPRGANPSGLTEAGAWLWEARGAGQFGAGSGAVKPLAPPEGGRWRWLKVREQDELPTGETNG